MPSSSITSSRLPAPALATSICLALSTLFTPVLASNALPTQTISSTATQLILSWPIQPTTAPAVPAALLRRDFRTVCGYIGGNPDLPATCMAGSHCVVDAEKKAIGCCPNQGQCTTGIFTDCVDDTNPSPGPANPHVFTCAGKNVCYKNSFQGGYFQYGCGSASNMATTVVLTASDGSSLTYMNPNPTTTLNSITSTSTTTNSDTSSSTASTTSTTSATTSADSPGATKSTPATASEVGGFETDAEKSKRMTTIIGSVVGALAGLIILLTLGAWLWRRFRKSPAPATHQDDHMYISRPLAARSVDYQNTKNMIDARPAPLPPGPVHYREEVESWPIPPMSSGNVIGGANDVMDTDQTPLTHGINTDSTNIGGRFSPVGNSTGMPRRGAERPFWQQGGGGARNYYYSS